MELLLEKGASLNSKTKDGITPLLIASGKGHKDIVELLLKSGVDSNIKKEDGVTPLMRATQGGYKDIVELLLASGANYNIKAKGYSSLMLATKKNYIEVLNLFNANKLHKKIKTKSDDASYENNNFDKDGFFNLEKINNNRDEKNIYDGYNKKLFNKKGINKLTKTKYDKFGYDEFGYDKNGFHNLGYHKETKNRYDTEGYDKNNLDKKGVLKEYAQKKIEIDYGVDKKVTSPRMIHEEVVREVIENKKVFIVKRFFRSYFSKRLDKEKFEKFLIEKGQEILNTKNYRELCNGDRIKKLKAKNEIFELRINSGDRVIFTFKEEGIIFLCVDDHDRAVIKGQKVESIETTELLADIGKIQKIATSQLIQNPIYEYNSLEEFEQAYEDNRELYKLTEEQKKILNQELPICLYGSAGSGKTTMLLKKIEKILRDNQNSKILFITHNEKLLKYSKSLYETYSGYKLKQIIFKDVNQFFKEELSLEEYKCFSYEEFTKWFNSKQLYNSKLKNLSLLEVFSEIKGIIRGFIGYSGRRDLEENMISKDYYLELKNKYSLLKNDEDRELVYSLALDYCEYLKKNKIYDENDLALKYLKMNTKVFKYDFLVCDEVQDLTELQILGMLKSISNKKNVFLAGDNNQAINLSYFDFSRLKTLYHENYDFNDIENNEISENQRSSKQIVELAKKVAEIRDQVLPLNKKINYREKAIIGEGNIPIIAPINIEQLAQLENKDITVIVPNENMKNKIERSYDNTVLTIYEMKGLERENIICIGLVDDFKDDVSEILKKIENNNAEKLSNHYRHFFNLFYVATTRAKKNLIFLDDAENKFFDCFENKIYKCRDGYWLNSLEKIENISDDKLLKYAKEFEEKELYSEALKNYRKMKNINSKNIKRVEAFLAFNEEKYKEACLSFERLEMWNKCLDCAKKLKNKENEKKYQIKVYEKEKEYLLLGEFYKSHSDYKNAYNAYMIYFKLNSENIDGEYKSFILEILPEVMKK
ncbi:ankyrin repeat domain-containing protein [Psychrilyobacter sp.]|uniref:ankyrin repeat domain-containing protein n=1 Tax=Psychrilyobacter sp. TaxID=2586924 RepID=UPI00301A7252